VKKYKKPNDQVPSSYENPLVKKTYQALIEKGKRGLALTKGTVVTEKYLIISMEKELRLLTAATNEQIFRMGEILVTVKKKLGHGDFGDWVRRIGLFSERTANNYMNIYNVCFGQREILQHFKRSVLEAICSPSFPEELRDWLFDICDFDEKISYKEIHQLREAYYAGDKGINSPDIQNLLARFHQVKVERSSKRFVYKFISIFENFENYIKSGMDYIDINPLIACDPVKIDVIPSLMNLILDVKIKLNNMLEDIDLALTVYEIEECSKTNKCIEHNSDIIDICEVVVNGPVHEVLNKQGFIDHLNQIDDGILGKVLRQVAHEQRLGPEDFIGYGDDGDLAGQLETLRTRKMIGELEPSDCLHQEVDGETLAEENYRWLINQLGPEDFISCDNDDEPAEECCSMVQSELAVYL